MPTLGSALLAGASLGIASPVCAAEPPTGASVSKATGKSAHGKVRTSAGRLRIGGRVLARGELAERPHRVVSDTALTTERTRSLDVSVASARLSAEYDAPVPGIRAVAELELADGPELKDGYVQARRRHWSLRAGQFKMPVSRFETESIWSLPLARRGFVHGLLDDWLDVGGRRPGLLAELRSGGPLHARLSVGTFQGSSVERLAPFDRDTALLHEQSLSSQSFVARAQIELGPVATGAWYEHRVGSPDYGVVSHYATAGADVALDWRVAHGGIRAWFDVIAGESWYEHAAKIDDGANALFVVARALVASRFGGRVDEAPYIEPFAYLALLEPDRDIRDDTAWEVALGLNAGFWRRARLTLQAEVNRSERNFPSEYLASGDADRLGLLLQAGVAF